MEWDWFSFDTTVQSPSLTINIKNKFQLFDHFSCLPGTSACAFGSCCLHDHINASHTLKNFCLFATFPVAYLCAALAICSCFFILTSVIIKARFCCSGKPTSPISPRTATRRSLPGCVRMDRLLSGAWGFSTSLRSAMTFVYVISPFSAELCPQDMASLRYARRW
jgi:hypothetical protein